MPDEPPNYVVVRQAVAEIAGRQHGILTSREAVWLAAVLAVVTAIARLVRGEEPAWHDASMYGRLASPRSHTCGGGAQ